MHYVSRLDLKYICRKIAETFSFQLGISAFERTKVFVNFDLLDLEAGSLIAKELHPLNCFFFMSWPMDVEVVVEQYLAS